MLSPDMLSRRTLLGQAGRIAMAAPFLTLLGCNEAPVAAGRFSLSGATMGTYYRITMSGEGKIPTPAQLQAGVERILRTVNGQMSTYLRDSELSRFNGASGTSWHEVSPDFAHVVARALEISRLSGSAFDPTIAPLVDLWGFGPEKPVVQSPGGRRIAAALRATGHAYLGVKETRTAIRKSRPDLKVDLSGIAKGFAVDRITDYLAAAGVRHFLIDIGGDMRAHRHSPDQAVWRIGIENPVVGLRSVHRVINIGDGAVATSGDYRNFFEFEGLRYAHIIDPRTGAPVTHGLASVTVIAPTTEEADAWSTALMVLGPDAGAVLAERARIPAFFITQTDRGLIDRPSSEFRRFLAA